MNNVFNKARLFVYQNARPLDIARWKYHFENGSIEEILTALSVYQNKDGGFGHAIEPDAWNPNSSPIDTWVATEILKEIGFSDKSHPIIQGILRYLGSGADFENGKWINTVPTNNMFPHAPWWYYDSADTSNKTNYNPTACLAGFALKYADESSKLYSVASTVAKGAFESYLSQGVLESMHTALCYIRLMEYCEEANINNLFDVSLLKKQLLKQVKGSITRNLDEWRTSYICKPSQFFNNKNSIFYTDNKEIAKYECEFIVSTQLDDGSWNINWQWEDYPQEWAITKNWWKSNGAILNILYLRGFDKLLVV
ncbi:hypothetical protein JYG23_09855 [Sedimentibacter sp. zth1]|uniref:hypothetical protein n=1 Tax=Sedimentibacter sp. zth1 TaxID=2816908 RepID=UPI001A9336A3|nr:hypothetical protein [Sedimentibacter sp. zth1]QSX04991.1 hypothetical protein JYG23_09855 [Sedimentibacter sp. zth1]